MASASRFVSCVLDGGTLIHAARMTVPVSENAVFGRVHPDASDKHHLFEASITFVSVADRKAAGYERHPFARVNLEVVTRLGGHEQQAAAPAPQPLRPVAVW